MTQICKFRLIHGKERFRGGRLGEVSPALFRELEKSALALEKNYLIAVIYELNFSFKMQFFGVFRRKSERFLPVWPFFLVL